MAHYGTTADKLMHFNNETDMIILTAGTRVKITGTGIVSI